MEISKLLDKVEEIKGGGERVLIGLNKLCLNEHLTQKYVKGKALNLTVKLNITGKHYDLKYLAS